MPRTKRRPWLSLAVALTAVALVVGLPLQALAGFTGSTTNSSSVVSAAPSFVDGSLYRWGSGTTPAYVPSAIGSGVWDQVAVGRNHACAIRTDQTLWCWGRNAAGSIGAGGTDVNVVYDPVQPVPGTRWIKIAAGSDYSCAIRDDGGLWCWGENGLGQGGQGVFGAPSFTPRRIGTASYKHVAARQTFGCAIRTDDTLWCWGWNFRGQLGQGNQAGAGPFQVSPGISWRTVDIGWSTACAIRSSDSTLWCWGANQNGELGQGDTTDRYTPTQVGTATDWSSVSTDDAVCGIRADTSLWCWGANDDGQLGLGDQIRRTSPQPVTSPAATGWEFASTGDGNTCALRTDKRLWCWGSNEFGRSGLGASIVRELLPAPIGTATDWVQLSSFWMFSCALRSDHSLWCWGRNDQGQFGASTTTPAALSA